MKWAQEKRPIQHGGRGFRLTERVNQLPVMNQPRRQCHQARIQGNPEWQWRGNETNGSNAVASMTTFGGQSKHLKQQLIY